MSCNGGSSNSPYNIPAPTAGQWVDFGGNEPAIRQGAQPSWDFPLCQGSTTGCSTIAGYFYTQLPAPPKVGQTLTITFNVRGANPVWQQQPAAGGNSETDINPPTVHVFLWRKNDNISCVATNVTYGPDGHTILSRNGGYADYRLFAGRAPLVIGDNQAISITLTADQWTNCWGSHPLAIGDELNDLVGIGVTFGGQWFAGHGVYLSGGSANFTVTKISVQ